MSGMNFKKTLLALLLTIALLVALTVPAFATEVTDAASAEETTELAAETEAVTEATEETEADAETDAETKADAETTKDLELDLDHDHDHEDEGMTTGDWISLGIGAAILVVLIVLAVLFITAKDDGTAGKDGGKVPFRIRGKRFFRSCKSEAKKVVWTPWKTVRKNTLVVLIVIVVCAIVIGLLDWLFTQGIVALTGLF